MTLPIISAAVFTIDGQLVTEHDVARFWRAVERSSGCWRWLGAPNHSGYGRLHVGGKGGRHLMAHRLSFAIHGAPPSTEIEVCHTCDNPICVRPDHLFLGTHGDNMADRDAKGRTPSGGEHWMQHLPKARRPRGEQHGAAILTVAQVGEIRTRYAAGDVSYGDLSAVFNVSRGTVRDIVKRRRWAHLE